MDLLTGAVTGFVAAGAWAFCVLLMRLYGYWRHFAPLSGTYESTRKLANKAEAERVVIRAKRGILHVTFENMPIGQSVKGEIAMNQELRRSGRGHYLHVKNGEHLWGFWDVQVTTERALLVHASFAAKTDPPLLVTSGFVWRRVDASAISSKDPADV
jgi:hypothetical protein